MPHFITTQYGTYCQYALTLHQLCLWWRSLWVRARLGDQWSLISGDDCTRASPCDVWMCALYLWWCANVTRWSLSDKHWPAVSCNTDQYGVQQSWAARGLVPRRPEHFGSERALVLQHAHIALACSSCARFITASALKQSHEWGPSKKSASPSLREGQIMCRDSSLMCFAGSPLWPNCCICSVAWLT